MAIAFVQDQIDGTAVSTASFTTIAFGSSTTTNNAIIVAVASSTAAVSSVTDSFSNTYNPAVSNGAQTGAFLSIWYALGITGGAAHTLTVNLGANPLAVNFYEISGLATSGALDQTSSNSNNTGTAITSGTTALTQASNELLFMAGAAHLGQTWTLGSGYANLTSNPQTVPSCGAEIQIVSSTGTYNGSLNSSLTGVWAGAIATFANVSLIPPLSVVVAPGIQNITGSLKIV